MDKSLLRNLRVDVREVDDHSRIMQLRLNHTLEKALFLGEAFSELRRELTIDGKLERVVLGNHMELIPAVFIDVVLGHGILYLGQGGLVVFINH